MILFVLSLNLIDNINAAKSNFINTPIKYIGTCL